MDAYFTEDLEFYHDKHGLTTGRSNLLDSVRSGLCGPGPSRLRRELVEGSLKAYPLHNYGAILSGEHFFHISEPGKAERRDGVARFTHVWRHEDGAWRMSRVLSYDHRPAPPAVARTPVTVPAETLEEYAGQYKAAAGLVVIALREGVLHLTAGPLRAVLHAASDRIFYVQDRDLQFEFVRDERGRVAGLTVRENGQIADRAVRQVP